MIISDNEKRALFFPDDFDRINNKFFKEMRDTGDITADPSYWYESESPVSADISDTNIHKYRSDYQNGLINEKSVIVNTISKWDNQPYDNNDLTVCSSVTAASYIVLGFLQERKVSSIIFETPAYFASISQANSLGFSTSLIPTYFSNNFQIDDSTIKLLQEYQKPKAIWLTQPRFGLGINQCKKNIEKIISCLKKEDFIIIDEATEQLFPVFLEDINFKKWDNIIKLRSFFKPTGINGPRLSFILHHSDYRNSIQNQLEVVQGAIDCFSLEFTCKVLNNGDYFKKMLQVSNNHVNTIRRKIETITRGTKIKINPLENGYIGSFAVKLNSNEKYYKEREKILFHCKEMKVPVILGASMYFAIDPSYEFIRLNFFNSEYNIVNGIQLILKS